MNSQLPLITEFTPTMPGMAACLFINPATCRNVPSFLFNADFGSIFWDIVHPTTEAHRFLAEYIYDQLEKEYD
jgi:phospholipase/lecithinase/hemolysin